MRCRTITDVYSDGRAAITRKLRDQLQTACVEYENASQTFAKVIADIPLRMPEGTREIKEAGEVTRAALRGYMEALSALYNFESQGILPDDF